MKKTRIIELLKNIQKTWVSFVSIVMFVALAVGVYAGFAWSGTAMQLSLNREFKDYDLYDFDIIYPYGVNDEGMEAISKIPDVTAVEGTYLSFQYFEKDNLTYQAKVMSLTEKINISNRIEGKLPEKAGEVAVGASFAKANGINIGDKITLTHDDDGKGHRLNAILNEDADSLMEGTSDTDGMKYLTTDTLTVTALLENVSYLINVSSCFGASFENNTPVDCIMYVNNKSFDKLAFNGYIDIFVRCESLDKFIEFDDDYQKEAKAIKDKIDRTVREIVDERNELIDDSIDNIIKTKQAELDEKQKELDEALITLNDSKAELNKAHEELVKADNEIKDGEKKLKDAADEIKKGEDELAEAAVKLEEAKKELEGYKKELEDARKKLSDGEAEIKVNEDKLKKASDELAAGKKKIDDGKAEYEAGKKEYANQKKKYDTCYNAYNTFNSGYSKESTVEGKMRYLKAHFNDQVLQPYLNISAEYPDLRDGTTVVAANLLNRRINSAPIADTPENRAIIATTEEVVSSVRRDLNTAKAELDAADAKLKEAENKIKAGETEYASKQSEYNDGAKKLEAAKKELEAGRKEFNAKAKEIQDGEKALADKQLEYENGLKELESGRESYASEEKKLNDAKAQYKEGQDKYAEGEAEIEKGQKEYDDAKSKIDDANKTFDELCLEAKKVEHSGYSLLTRQQNFGASASNIVKDTIENIRFTMAILFIVVGMLVCYSAVSRIIYDQSILVGAKKALGFTNLEVTFSYLQYSLMAVLVGSVIGTVVARWVLEPTVINVFSETYRFSTHVMYIDWGVLNFIIAIEFALILLATLVACARVLKKNAVDLIYDTEIRKGRKHLIERFFFWKKFSTFIQTVIINFLSDKKRVIATVVGAGGCTALIVCAVSIYFTVTRTFDNHYEKVAHYDHVVYYDSTKEESAEGIKKVLEENNIKYSNINYAMGGMTDQSGRRILCYLSVYSDDSFKQMMDVHSMDGASGGQGVWISAAYAKKYNVKAGDKITFYNSLGVAKDFEVAGSMEYYLTRLELVMDAETYKDYYGLDSVNNSFLISIDDNKKKELDEKLQNVDGYLLINDYYRESKESFDVFTVIAIVFVLIYLILSVLMALLVLLNLYVMCVQEKKNELIVMMINGYSVARAKSYIYADNILLTLIGIVVGVAVGLVMGQVTINKLETNASMFINLQSTEAILYGAFVTVFLSILMTLIAIRRVNKFKLSEMTSGNL